MLNELYPSRPWQPGALILPPWKAEGGTHVAPSWQLGAQAGVLSVPFAKFHWNLEWEAKHTVLVSPHGVFELSADPQEPLHFCAFCPEPGILIGESNASHTPNLHTPEGHVVDREDGEELETADSLVRLYCRESNGRTFFVVVVLHDQAGDPSALLSRYAEVDPLESLRSALAPYQSFAQRQTGLEHDQADRLQSHVAALICGLRSSRDGARLFAAPDESGRFQTRHLYELVIAWSEIRIDFARALLHTLLNFQQPDGALPRALDELGSPGIESLHIPLLAHCFEQVWRQDPDRAWFDYAAPRVQRHLEFIVQSLDPDRTGRPLWPSQLDSLAPELFESDLYTPDLPALLIHEISTLEKIADAIAIRSLNLTDLLQYRDLLLAQMREVLWSAEKQSFTERYVDDRPLMRQAINTLLPLICTELTHDEVGALTNLLLSRQHFLGSTGFIAWIPWGTVATLPPVWPVHQLLLLEALEARHAVTEVATVRGILLAHPPADTALAWDALAIHLLAVPSGSRFNARIISPALHWLNRHRRATFATALALFALFNGLVFLYSCTKTTLTPQTIETTAGLARRYYQEKNFEASEQLLMRIIESKQPYPTANMEMGNIQYRMGNLTEAERFYRIPSSTPLVQAQMLQNLAVLLYEQGRTNEALAAWKQIRDEFSVPAPQVTERANTALKLLGEIGAGE
ncbi:MAG: hypothetical protein M9935_02790 [Kiritimatiellae bacterium]|nr:hypothetical protein [Kiritimatiellia bacterium]